MSTHMMARSAYATPGSATRTLRDTEYDAFSRVTRRLGQHDPDTATGYAALVQALYDNRQMWMTFASDVAGNENRLPSDLRAQIFYLAEFTNQHSRKVLSRQSDVQVLIDINTAVMRGLRRDRGEP